MEPKINPQARYEIVGCHSHKMKSSHRKIIKSHKNQEKCSDHKNSESGKIGSSTL